MASKELILTFLGTGAMRPAFRRGSTQYVSKALLIRSKCHRDVCADAREFRELVI